jgi:hypothetical protein
MQKKRESADMSEYPEEHVEANPQLFPSANVPVSKLTAYFVWKAKIEEKERMLENNVEHDDEEVKDGTAL